MAMTGLFAFWRDDAIRWRKGFGWAIALLLSAALWWLLIRAVMAALP